MSSTMSSDEYIKTEIVDQIGYSVGDIQLRIFPEGSNDDQLLFSEGGLTFANNGLVYGSCDAVWYLQNQPYKCYQTGRIVNEYPVLALEGTDALQRGSSGNAQYQRFHHALGAVREGIIGVYYLKRGNSEVQSDLLRMAYNASKVEAGTYIITQDLQEVKYLLELIAQYGLESSQVCNYLNHLLEEMKKKFDQSFVHRYKGSWETFAEKRSTILNENYVTKYAGRMKRNFTDSSQRAGHIAVGEMYLSAYFFDDKHLFYLFPRMSNVDFHDLDTNKKTDKEWALLRNEPRVVLLSRDDLVGLPAELYTRLEAISEVPLKGADMKEFNEIMRDIRKKLESGDISISESKLNSL